MHLEGRDLSKHNLVSTLDHGEPPPVHGPSSLIQLRGIAFCSSWFFAPLNSSVVLSTSWSGRRYYPIKRKRRYRGIYVN